MNETCLLDASNQPVVYTEDGEHLFLYSGEAVGYIFEDSVYSYPGRHLGWIGLGGIHDRTGALVLRTVPPGQTVQVPWKGMKAMVPFQNLRDWKPARPVALQFGWSPLSVSAFFQQT